MPKIGSWKIFGRPNFQGGSQYTHISAINMYKFIKIRHDIIKQCHGNYKDMKRFNYKLEIEIVRNTQIFWGVLRGSFQGSGCPKKHPDALLAKTMALAEYSQMSTHVPGFQSSLRFFATFCIRQNKLPAT